MVLQFIRPDAFDVRGLNEGTYLAPRGLARHPPSHDRAHERVVPRRSPAAVRALSSR